MFFRKKHAAKTVSVTVCFAALYAVFGFLPISKIIGLNGYITAATIMAPIIGVLLGPYIGAVSVVLGGVIGFFVATISTPSLVSGVIATLCAGMLCNGKRSLCAFVYFSMLFLFGFYPFVGPIWLYLPLVWFQIAVFLILISPIQSMATRRLNSNSDSKILSAFFVTSLTSTLAGQIAGSLTFEVISWPIFMADVNTWRSYWHVLTFVYPIERTIIALCAALIGISLHKALQSANLTVLSRESPQETSS
ncbi:MAG: hypothetical protein OEY22_01295 [Candidatus Bathyarchaeota archaeon]|nr:hypothetical protein [Candidatus Bathyarchaeota archaeon]MDH5788935.1 hypothetical protein [Candidatus Bathyarchaeota archaeon]